MGVLAETRMLLERLANEAEDAPGCPIWHICKECESQLPKSKNSVYKDCKEVGSAKWKDRFQQIRKAIEVIKTLENMTC